MHACTLSHTAASGEKHPADHTRLIFSHKARHVLAGSAYRDLSRTQEVS